MRTFRRNSARKFHGISDPHNNSNSNKYILYSLLLRVDKRNIYSLLLSSALLLDFR